MAPAQSECILLEDGSSVSLSRVAGVDGAVWSEARTHLARNPDMARSLLNSAKNPEAMRGWMQTQATAELYKTKLRNGEAQVQEHLKSLEQDPELVHVFEDIRKNGLEAAIRYHQDEELMLKISQRLGSLPQELQPVLKKIDATPLNVHEATKRGDLKAVQEYMAKGQPLDVQDKKGITPLGYAIGANNIAMVKLLLDKRANAFAVDRNGNCSLHYAAGYGREELVEYLLKHGASVNQSNAKGETPLLVATINKQVAVVEYLQQHGALII